MKNSDGTTCMTDGLKIESTGSMSCPTIRRRYMRLGESDECLSYQVPVKPFEISEEDFRKTAMDYLMYKRASTQKRSADSCLTE